LIPRICLQLPAEKRRPTTVLTEAILGGTQLFLKQKRQFCGEGLTKYITAQEEVKKAWKIFDCIDSERDHEITECSMLEEYRENGSDELKVN
jgi:hypothetical protein